MDKVTFPPVTKIRSASDLISFLHLAMRLISVIWLSMCNSIRNDLTHKMAFVLEKYRWVISSEKLFWAHPVKVNTAHATHLNMCLQPIDTEIKKLHRFSVPVFVALNTRWNKREMMMINDTWEAEIMDISDNLEEIFYSLPRPEKGKEHAGLFTY